VTRWIRRLTIIRQCHLTGHVAVVDHLYTVLFLLQWVGRGERETGEGKNSKFPEHLVEGVVMSVVGVV